MPITSTFSTATPRAYGYGIGGSAPTPPSAATDPQWNYVTALLHGTTEGSTSGNIFTDASTNNFTVTPSATPNTIQSAFTPFTVAGSNQSWSNYFDGSSYLSVPNNSALDLGTGDFTIEGWWYFSDTSNQALISKYSSGQGFVVQYQSGNLRLVLGLGGASDVVYTFAWTPAVNTWYHIAITRSGTSGRAFVNGAQIGTTTTVTTSNTTSSTTLQIGLTHTVSEYTRGYVSNVRLSKGVAVYTAAFSPPTAPLTATTGGTTPPTGTQCSLLTCASSSFKDIGGLATPNTISIGAGTPKVRAAYPFDASVSSSTTNAYGSGYFSASPYLSLSSSTAFSSSVFTVEAWIYPTAFASVSQIIGSWDSAGSLSWTFSTGTSGQLGFVFTTNGTYNPAYDFATATNVLKLNSWQHVAVTRNSDSTFTLWVNGTASYTTGVLNQTIYTNTSAVKIGNNGNSQSFTGFISNVRIVNGVTVYTGAFTVPTSPLATTQSSGTNIAAITGTSTSLLTLQNNSAADNNTFLDQSPNYFPVTRNGTPTQGTFSPFAPSNESWSQYYGSATNCNTQYLYNGTSIIAQGTAYTLEGWFYATIAPTGNSNTTGLNIGCTSVNSASTGNGHVWGIGSTAFYFQNNASTGAYNTISWTPTLNQWFHLAFVTTNGTNYTLYINGTSVGTATDAGSWYNDSTFSFYLGSTNGNGTYCPNGLYMSNVRYTKKAVYTGAFTVPTGPLSVTQSAGTNIAAISSGECTLLTAQSNRYVDNGSLSLVASIPFAGTYSIQRFQPFLNYQPYSQAAVGGSGYFNSSNSEYIYTPSGKSELNLYNQSWTIDGWVYKTQSSVQASIIQQDSYNVRVAFTAANVIEAYIGETGGSAAAVTGTTVVPTNTWCHFVWQYNKATALHTLYVNGVSQGTCAGYVGSSTSAWYIGEHITAGWYFPGYMSNIRIIKGSAVYSGNFTPPTGPVSSYPYAGTSLLLNFSNAGVYDNGMVGDYITGGDTKTKYVSGVGNPFSASGYSMYFDGTGDYLSSANNLSIGFGTGAFTLEMWINPSNASSEQMLICGSDTGSFFLGMNIDGANRIALGRKGVAVDNYVSYTYTTGAWIYLAVTRDSSSNVKFYVNGSQVGTTATNSNSFVNSVLNVGYEPTPQKYFNGYMSNLRISKGYARTITASPTAAFPDIGATAPSTGYQVFNSSGAFTVPAGVSTLYYGIVGGGAGGGGGLNGVYNAGGGGAGGVLTGSLAVTAGQIYSVIVGGGGAGGAAAAGNNGSNSSVLGLISYGGGGGGASGNGVNGGSGGGGGGPSGATSAGSGITGQGYAGSNSSGGFIGGSGGGAGGAGSGATGGSGVTLTVGGTSFGALAGGAISTGYGSGTGNGGSATANTGSGGAAGYASPQAAGGNGGSGLVVLKW
jgi:hypothetical protein